MLPAHLCLVGYAGQKIENRLGLELRRKRTSCASHGKVSLGGPVLTSILVQRQGRTARVDPSDSAGIKVRPLGDTRIEISIPRSTSNHSQQVQGVKELLSQM